MKQENKELLLKDLSARLPYGVKGIIPYDESNTTFTVEGIDNNVLHLSDAEECYVEDFKPYLRPMSSMTEEERDELELLCDGLDIDDEGNSFYYMSIIKNHKSNTINFKIIDFLISRHFDYRGLIEKGLAIEAPEGMYE